jgi:diketogulonate reductase-like aldo/keto reductase
MRPMPAAGPLPDFLYGTAWKEDRTAALTELALRAGFRGIDTANQRRHYFEAGVGQGLAAAYRAGVVRREDLFLQTKYTYRPGQDHRLPYDPAAALATQVAQSLASSLEHLGTDHVDSLVLHGPASSHGWTEYDAEVWAAMVRERDAGRTRRLGVSNVSLRHLEQLEASGAELPAFVQNRCFAAWAGTGGCAPSAGPAASSTRASRSSPPTPRCWPTRGSRGWPPATASPRPRSSSASRWRWACCR